VVLAAGFLCEFGALGRRVRKNNPSSAFVTTYLLMSKLRFFCEGNGCEPVGEGFVLRRDAILVHCFFNDGFETPRFSWSVVLPLK